MLNFDGERLRRLEWSLEREWLCTNGNGGYAGGSLAGAATRRYHALLVAARGDLQRVVTLVRVEAWAHHRERRYDLSSALFRDGNVEPAGHEHLDGFTLEGSTPVWRWTLDDARLEFRALLARRRNSVYLQYAYLEGEGALDLYFEPLVALRDHHGESDPTRGPAIGGRDGHLFISIGAVGVALGWDATGESRPIEPRWRHDYFWPEEAYRHRPDGESLLALGEQVVTLVPGADFQIVATTEPDVGAEVARRAPDVARELRAREQRLLTAARPMLGEMPDWIARLVLAADQFVIEVDRGGRRRTVVAGYPWFTDWGRDTMISIEGLALATGRPELAASLLRAFAGYVDQGMIPNRFPEAGHAPEYNTADATLWFFEALGRTWEVTGDDALLAELFPVLEEIAGWHLRGTRYGIHIADDGLLAAGERGSQLTWMDVRIGDEVPTPRHGKPVELSALWYNAMRWMGRFATVLGHDPTRWEDEARRTRTGFARFWNPERGFLYDVLDRDGEADPALRPNQLFALSLSHPVLNASDRAERILAAIEDALLTPVGLRSLAPDEPGYRGTHSGPADQFDRAYHNGTVWGWLIGPYVRARLRQGEPPDELRVLLAGFRDHLEDECIGTVSEIFDGDPPHAPRGAFAQAWSVAELLALWMLTQPEEETPQ